MPTLHTPARKRICLVTEEIAGFAGSGGIGAAFEELAVSLATAGHIVDILHTPIFPSDPEEARHLYERFMRDNVQLISMDFDQHVWGGEAHEKRAYAIYHALRTSVPQYDVIHFHDYKGFGYFAAAAKRQGLDFHSTTLVVQAHGPTRWALEANNALFVHPDQIKIDFMERKSIELCDVLVSPSQYLVDWMKTKGYKLPAADRVHVIKNVCTLATRFSRNLATGPEAPVAPANEIILFARHEGRKGFVEFCKAVDSVADLLAERQIAVTFLGKLGDINGRPSGVELTNRAKNWKFPINIRTKWDRYAALNYLAGNPRSLVVIPSRVENSPYTVLEAVVLKKAVLTSTDGGARELIDASLHQDLLCPITAKNLAAKLTEAVTVGLPHACLAEMPESIEQRWRDLHNNLPEAPVLHGKNAKPRVVFGITHYERPEKLLEAVLSAARQTYENMEIVVVDDGSKKLETLEKLRKIEVFLKRLGGRIIYRENGYLGAARNTIAKNTKSDYLIFLDDDDIALDTMVETLVEAAENTGADITGCLNFYMEEVRREREKPAISPESFQQKVSYVPLGGPLSLSPFENTLGAATALIRRSHFNKIGGYTEIHGVGFEDYEFYVRSLQEGANLQIVPRALYLYEVGRPSMISNTSVMQNFQRVLDVINFKKNDGEWRDFMCLYSGREAIVNNSNRIEWEYKADKLNEFLVPLLHGNNGSPEYAESLAQYSEAVGAPTLAQAWRLSSKVTDRAASIAAAGETAFVSLVPVRAASEAHTVETSGLTQDDAAIVVDLSMDRIDAAAERLAMLIDARIVIDVTLSELVRETVRRAGDRANSEAFLKLMKSLLDAKIQPENQISVTASALLISSARMAHETTHNILANLFNQDEAEYLLSNPDVRQAVEVEKTFANGLHHFKEEGMEAGLSGYPRLFALCSEIRKSRKWDVAPWTISDVLGVPGSIQRGPAARRVFKITARA